jgi:WD40 repeat protein
VLASGNKLYFYQYELPLNSSIKDDVKRQQQRGLYKLLQCYKHPTAQHISSFSFHNSRVTSPVGIIGGSNKEIVIYDANVNKPIQIVNDGHFKHAHTVKFYEGSFPDSEAYNTFLTSSSDNTIKLWDLRVGNAIRTFSGHHQNRSLTIGFDISNCYRYLLTGSEDRCAYVYDVGSGQLVEKTKNKDHGDSVTDVAINPKFYEWATSSIDGHVRVFRHPATKVGKGKN